RSRHQLLSVCRLADPHPLRDRLRDALEGKAPVATKELAASLAEHISDPVTTVLLLHLAEVGGKERSRIDEEVLAALRQAQQRRPDDFWLNESLGLYPHHLTPPRLEEAVRYYAVAVALRPRSPGARYNLGNALQQEGKLDEAIEAYRMAIHIQPDYAN